MEAVRVPKIVRKVAGEGLQPMKPDVLGKESGLEGVNWNRHDQSSLIPHSLEQKSAETLKAVKRSSKPKRKIFDENEPRMKLPNEEEADATESLIEGETMIQSVQLEKHHKSLTQVQVANFTPIVTVEEDGFEGRNAFVSSTSTTRRDSAGEKKESPITSPVKNPTSDQTLQTPPQTRPRKKSGNPPPSNVVVPAANKKTPGEVQQPVIVEDTRPTEGFEVVEEFKGNSPIEKTKRAQPMRVSNPNHSDESKSDTPSPSPVIKLEQVPEQDLKTPEKSGSSETDSMFMNQSKLNSTTHEDTEVILSPITTKMNAKAPVSPEARQLIQQRSKEEMAATEKESCKACNLF